MKKALISFCTVFTLGVAGLFTLTMTPTAQADTAVTQATDQTQSFAIENMSCAMCPITVRTAMQRVDGVHSVTVDFETKTAVAVFDPAQTSASAIADASTNVGYPATVVGKTQ